MIFSSNKFSAAVFCGLLSGILLGLTWRPLLPPVFVALGFVPVWAYWIKNPRILPVIGTGILAATIGVLIACPWVGETARGYWPVSRALAAVITVGFASVAYIYLPAAGLLWLFASRKFKISGIRSLLLLPLFQATLECAFPFFLHTHFGYTWLWSGLPIVQLADLVGMAGLSLAVYFLNFAALIIFLMWRQGLRKQSVSVFVLTLSAFLILNLVAYLHGRSQAVGEENLKALLIQPNVSPPDIARARLGDSFVSHYVIMLDELTRDGIHRFGVPDLVIWPENAVPLDINAAIPEAEKVRRLATEIGVPIISGVAVVEAENKRFSAMALINRDGSVGGVHKKSVLMPFGEYIPGSELIPKLNQFNRHRTQIAQGETQSVISVGNLRIGGGICYEGILSWPARNLANQNANIFINITNDFWFGNTAAPWQHLNMTLSRALEYRRPIIRVGNSGVSAVVLANGLRIAESPVFEPWASLVNIPYQKNPEKTFYQRFGNYLLPILLLAISLVLANGKFRAPKFVFMVLLFSLGFFSPKLALAADSISCAGIGQGVELEWEGQVKPNADSLQNSVKEQLKFWSARFPYRFISRTLLGLSVDSSQLKTELLHKTDMLHYRARVPALVCLQKETENDPLILPLPFDPFHLYRRISPQPNPCSTISNLDPASYPTYWSPYRFKFDSNKKYFDCQTLMKDFIFKAKVTMENSSDSENATTFHETLSSLLTEVKWQKIRTAQPILRTTVIIPASRFTKNLAEEMAIAEVELKKWLESKKGAIPAESLAGVKEPGGQLQFKILRGLLNGFSESKPRLARTSNGLEVSFDSSKSAIRIVWIPTDKSVPVWRSAIQEDGVVVFAGREGSTMELLKSITNKKAARPQFLALLSQIDSEIEFEKIFSPTSDRSLFVLSSLADYRNSEEPILSILENALGETLLPKPEQPNLLWDYFFIPRADFPKMTDEYFWRLKIL